MKTIAVPVEPTIEWSGRMKAKYPNHSNYELQIMIKDVLAAAPPQPEPDQQAVIDAFWQAREKIAQQAKNAAVKQPEPADHLADPDSLERARNARARNALRAITNAGSIGHAKRIAMQALGDTNAAPEQSERESITSPSQEGCAVGTAPAAAPVWSNCALSRCQASMRCEWPDTCQTEQNAAGQEPMPDTERGIAADRGNPFACKPDNAGNERPSGGLSTNSPVSAASALEPAIKPTREAADAFWKYWRENGETHKHGYYESTWGSINAALRTSGVVMHNYHAPIPGKSAAPSTLPLSAKEIADFRGAYGHTERYRVLCDQALRAIELKKDLEVERAGNKAVYERAHMLEQQLAGLKGEWFHRGQESVQRKNESGCCCKIGDDDKILSACDAHSEWAKQQVAELEATIARDDENINDLAARECKERQRAEKAEAELAELKARKS